MKAVSKMSTHVVYSVILSIITSVAVVEVLGHGYMFSPINRASRWRLYPTNWDIPHNYEDNQYFCGGYSVQYEVNEGKCGPCGDDWRDPVPRSNENGGTYGNGTIAARYFAGTVVKVDVMITANHLGYISYQLCKLSNSTSVETEDCFTPLPLVDGSYSQAIGKDDFNVTSYVQLPQKFWCKRCVLRWHYSAGNNWGICENGTSAMGCGPQETFRSCADIRILPRFWLWPLNYFNKIKSQIL